MDILLLETTDPRIRRTRQLLHQALGALLVAKAFEEISIQEIADAATVNRATFYAHFKDKFALLESMVGLRMKQLLAQRGIAFTGCSSALNGLILAVCDYLADAPGAACESQGRMQPHLESAVVAVLRGMFLDGLRQHPGSDGNVSTEMRASAISWAIYGAAREWVRTPGRGSSDEIAATIAALVLPMLPAE